MAAARTLFVQHGYDQTTTRMIADASGVTDALIYRHFQSKKDLLLALVEEMTNEFAAMAGSGPARPLGHDAPAEVVLAVVGARFAEVFQTHLDLIVLLLTHRDILAGDRRFVTFIDQAAQRLGLLLDPTDSDHGYLLARGFMGAIASFGLLQHTLDLDHVHPLDVHDYVTALVPLFANARRDDRAQSADTERAGIDARR